MIHRSIVLSLVMTFVVAALAASPGGQKAVTFTETLSITQDDWFPYQIIVDTRGNIFVLSGRERTLLGFDLTGREVLRRQIPRGRGPGEFDSFDPVFSPDGRLFAADWAQRRLTILDLDFKVVHIEKMSLYGDEFQMDSKGQRYFLAYQASKARERNRVVLTKCAPSGDVVKEIVGYEWGPRRRVDGMYEDNLYRTQLKYALDAQDNLIYAFSSKYEVFVASPSGELVQTITRDVKPRKVEKEDVDRLLPDPSKKSAYQYLVPDRVPAIAGLFPLKDGHLLVVTFEKAGEETSLAGDLFDINGRFLGTVRVPKYYRWDFLLAPMKSQAFVWNDGFCTIESDADEERFWVKRYRIEWK
ncbi:MAG: hypothetical protein A2V76_10670 [Candidatus Aminicenantes bacterium RBG_16_63_14]|nr:MAG: hypothetical protein A2V76_10670 [Candidatus Aminicenantes bacterium RBG_16_63_14]